MLHCCYKKLLEHIHGYYTFCIKYLCPVIMFFILLVQISTFFGLGWFN